MPVQQHRRVCFTLNNPTDDEITSLYDRLREQTVRYAIVGKETGNTGTPHLQGYVAFTRKQSFKQIKELIPRSHIERSKGSEEDNFVYCSKDGDYLEFGTKEKPGKRNDLEEIAEQIQNGASIQEIAEYKPATYIRNYRGLANFKQLQVQDYTHTTTRGIWIYGAPGTGKSHHARLHNPSSTYMKPQSKWWDGYAGEECVILDDLDTNVLGHYLKIWADKYACSGEVKGGTIKLQHTSLIITSNYTIDSLYSDQPNMCAAIKRRFKEIYMTGLTEHLDLVN